jgi:hypothetical protein
MQQPGKEVPLLGRTGAMQHTLDGDLKGQAAAEAGMEELQALK